MTNQDMNDKTIEVRIFFPSDRPGIVEVPEEPFRKLILETLKEVLDPKTEKQSKS